MEKKKIKTTEKTLKKISFLDMALFAAVKAEDWATAAKESHRKDVGNERNDNIRKLFEDAEAKQP